MASKLLIIHGYSDGATSFTALRDFFVESGAYPKGKVFLLNYDSLDDESTFEDFADKLDEDYRKLFQGERIDVACHSTGALVARAWLRLHYQRQRDAPVSPVEHLLMFAPANFGSDLARLGQSFLGKFRSTFFNSNHQREDFMESGRIVLQGLEPASPFQWSLSSDDLHGDGYFNPALGEGKVCFPFVFAAGKAYGGLQGKLIPARGKAGTDGTVRICGTSLNTRKCVVDFAQPVVRPVWVQERKFPAIPFATSASSRTARLWMSTSRSRPARTVLVGWRSRPPRPKVLPTMPRSRPASRQRTNRSTPVTITSSFSSGCTTMLASPFPTTSSISTCCSPRERSTGSSPPSSTRSSSPSSPGTPRTARAACCS
jgi:hypothetical protein